MLSHFERYEEALEVINEEKELYINSEKNAIFYVKVLIKVQSFIEAEYIIQKFKLAKATEDKQAWMNLAQNLSKEREKASFKAKLRRDETKKALRELEQYSHMVQVKKIRDAEILDLSELQEVAPLILISTNISGTVQRYFLELLIQKGDQNIYSFMWFNQIKKLRPSELSKFDDVEVIHEISEEIEHKLAKYPDLETRVKIEIMHDLLLLYPYIEETVKDVTFWVEAYISQLDFFNYMEIEQISTNQEQQDMLKWIDYLNAIAQREEMFKD